MRRYKRLLLLFTLSVVVVLGSTQIVSATQSKSGNFNKNYSLSADQAQSLVNVAAAQIGKTRSSLGYTEAWCADFVNDCAKLTGMSSAIIPYTYGSRGSSTSLYNYMVNNCHATKVTTRQKPQCTRHSTDIVIQHTLTISRR